MGEDPKHKAFKQTGLLADSSQRANSRQDEIELCKTFKV